MILRTPTPDSGPAVGDDGPDPLEQTHVGWSRRAPLRWQLSMVTAVMVAVAVGVMTVVAYWTVSTSLTRHVDEELKDKASSLLQNSFDPAFVYNPAVEVATFKTYNPDIRVAYYPPGSVKAIGDSIPILDEVDVLQGTREVSVRSSGDERIFAESNKIGATVILAQDMRGTHQLISSLGLVLLLIGGIGVLIAIAAGMVVATTGLRPVSRLRQAVDYVARTDDLRPITVVGNDELAQLTRSFNGMLAALSASRRRQAELVADAGHELKTPLTSLRTNIELLMMVDRQGGASISQQDRRDLERDVIAQIEELSTLIGDLVDLAREDGPQQIVECVDLVECMETSLERVRRRRPDVTFTFASTPWFLYGDPFALGRATLNLMDNAAKWSPEGGEVRIDMEQVSDGLMEIRFSDSGPGIPVEDRQKVFERFYRSIAARSMPGSGLGLAIVAQVIARHAGTIVAEESDDGGAMMRVTLPGTPSVDDTVDG
ncbi:HAMP domain-containing histidine kinase [Corynebacterium sp. CCM 9185]|nr:HAMP domain-containing sensor histidine kinase [Corynebacterium marambiense]MCK7663314.1 HAMP domain-containing histidine kinase [Corynebacterium marambiense]MCX7542251.1 HAMP domain-containing sensor histidine kinase [Corynebacterium marambiense]